MFEMKGLKLPAGHDDKSSIKSIDDCLCRSVWVCGKEKKHKTLNQIKLNTYIGTTIQKRLMLRSATLLADSMIRIVP